MHTQAQAVKDTYIQTHGPLGNEAVIQKWHRFRNADNNVIQLLCPKEVGQSERESGCDTIADTTISTTLMLSITHENINSFK